jgi:hypothetical protein
MYCGNAAGDQAVQPADDLADLGVDLGGVITPSPKAALVPAGTDAGADLGVTREPLFDRGQEGTDLRDGRHGFGSLEVRHFPKFPL